VISIDQDLSIPKLKYEEAKNVLYVCLRRSTPSNNVQKYFGIWVKVEI